MFVVKYRYAGKIRWYTIGWHGSPWTVDNARAEARRVLGDLARGIDPQAAKTGAERARRNTPAMADLCDRHLGAARNGLILTRFSRPKKTSTLAIDVGRIERHIKPLIGHAAVTAVTPAMVRRMIQDITAGKTATDTKTGLRGRAIVTGGPGTAAWVADLLSGIMAWAVKEERIERNPVHGVKRYRGEARDRFLSKEEIGRLGAALRSGAADDGKPVNPMALSVVKLLLLTGCRAEEIESLRWSEVDLEQRCLRLEDTKAGKSLRALGKAAADELAGTLRVAGSP